MAVNKPQIDQFAPAPALTSCGELMEILDIISAKLQMPQGTSHVKSSHMRFPSGKSQSYIFIFSPPSDTVPNLSLIKTLKHVNPVSF